MHGIHPVPSHRRRSTALADLEKFRVRNAGFHREKRATEPGRQGVGPGVSRLGRKNRKYPTPDAKAWLERAAEVGLTAPTWPKEYGGAGLSREEGEDLRARAGSEEAPRASRRLRTHDDRTHPSHLRERGAEARAFAAHHPRRDPLVPGLFRARRRKRSRFFAVQRRARRRSLHRQRTEDLDDFGDYSDWMFILVRTDPTAKKQRASASFCSIWTRRA